MSNVFALMFLEELSGFTVREAYDGPLKRVYGP